MTYGFDPQSILLDGYEFRLLIEALYKAREQLKGDWDENTIKKLLQYLIMHFGFNRTDIIKDAYKYAFD